jgi:hypothetical protein
MISQAPLSLTSLDIAQQLLEKPAGSTSPAHSQTAQTVPLADVLQGISSLRHLSCPVRITPNPLTVLRRLTARSSFAAMSPVSAHDTACS